MQPANQLFDNLRDERKSLTLPEIKAWLDYFPIDQKDPENDKVNHIEIASEILSGKPKTNSTEKQTASKKNGKEALYYEVFGRAFSCRSNSWELSAFADRAKLSEEQAGLALDILQEKLEHAIETGNLANDVADDFAENKTAEPKVTSRFPELVSVPDYRWN